MKSASLTRLLTGPTLPPSGVAEDAQVALPPDLGDRAVGRSGTGSRGRDAGGARGTLLADRLGQRHEVVGGQLGVRREAHDVPAAGRGEPGGVLLAQVVGVRLGVGRQRSQYTRML